MSRAWHKPEPHPRMVSEAIFSWLKGISAVGLTAQVADWQEEQWAWARHALHVHGITPLLYKTLQGRPAWQQLPPSFQETLARYYELSGQRLAIWKSELQAILEATWQAGIPVLPLKGAVLIGHYYEDPALRPMADLDFLVSANDQERVTELLRELGYQEILGSPRHRRFLLTRRGVEIASTQYEHPDNPYPVELHTEVADEFRGLSYRITGDLWAASAPALSGATPGLSVKPWALLQHLLIHASRDLIDHQARLLQLYDLSLVIPRLSRSDWEVLGEAAGRRGGERWLYAPLRLMARYLGGSPPPEVMAKLAQDTPARLRLFLEGVDLYTLSYLNRSPKILIDPLGLQRSGRDLLAVAWHFVLGALYDLPHPIPRDRPSLTGYPIYGLRQVLRIMGFLLRLAGKARPRSLIEGHP